MRECRYRLLCSFLCAAILSMCFVGCFLEKGSPDGSSEESLTNDSSEPSQTVLTLADSGESLYSIYYDRSLSSDETFMSVMGSMAKLIYSGTGVHLAMSTDSAYTEALSDRPAILIGVTKWPESQQAAANLKKINDYSIGIIGNKLVICGRSNEACTTAVQYFINRVVAPQLKKGNTLTFSMADAHTEEARYGIDSVKILDTELSQYRIVLPKNADVNEAFFAYQLRYWLMQNYGFLLDIADDSAKAEPFEILVGNTLRSSTRPAENEYSVRAADGKLELSANGYAAYDELYHYITQTLIPSGSGASYTVSERADTVPAAADYENRTSSTLAGTGDVRVMYFNIYGYGDYLTSVRSSMQLELFKTYAPDVIGMQEFSAGVRRSGLMSGLTELGYAEVQVTGVSSDFTPLFYRTDTLDVVESGYLLYDGLNDVNSKSITWAVFRTKESGKCFIALSTHFYYTSDQEGLAARISEARQLIELIGKIRTNPEYADLPLVMGGDLNCVASSEPAGVLKDGGLILAWDEAVSKNNVATHHSHAVYSNVYHTYTNTYRPSGGYANAIDQVYISPGVTVNRFSTLVCSYALIASDHCPVLVDISFT